MLKKVSPFYGVNQTFRNKGWRQPCNICNSEIFENFSSVVYLKPTNTIMQVKVNFAGIIELTNIIHGRCLPSSNSLNFSFATILFWLMAWCVNCFSKKKSHYRWRFELQESLILFATQTFANSKSVYKKFCLKDNISIFTNFRSITKIF